MAGVGNTTPRKLEAQERMYQALEMRKAGMGYKEIAEALGYTCHASAVKAVQRALKQTLREPADDVRELELERLEAMWRKTWEWIERGDPRAIDRALRIMERRAKYLGLDAPTLYKWLLEQEAQRVATATGKSKHDVLADVQTILAEAM